MTQAIAVSVPGEGERGLSNPMSRRTRGLRAADKVAPPPQTSPNFSEPIKPSPFQGLGQQPMITGGGSFSSVLPIIAHLQ